MLSVAKLKSVRGDPTIDPSLVFEVISSDGFMTRCRPLGETSEQMHRFFRNDRISTPARRYLERESSFYGIELLLHLAVPDRELVVRDMDGGILLTSNPESFSHEQRYKVLGALFEFELNVKTLPKLLPDGKGRVKGIACL